MELCTAIQTQSAISNHHHPFLTATTAPALARTKSALSLKQTTVSRSGYGLRSRILYYTNPLPKATSEETSSGTDQYVVDKRDGATAAEDVPAVEKNVNNESAAAAVPKEESPVDGLTNELLDNLKIKFDSEDKYSLVLYGTGALLALWLTTVVVGAIDSIPLFPKLMEVVGLGYTLWFSWRYLLFKKNRDELATKIEELKQQALIPRVSSIADKAYPSKDTITFTALFMPWGVRLAKFVRRTRNAARLCEGLPCAKSRPRAQPRGAGQVRPPDSEWGETLRGTSVCQK
ncbi:protein CURVATURE THYLAKOID 1D [Citrus sinensis]|uniref:Protein CURVATURE THYLAKOID 1D n=1 Tax=Citrus sinensis TaxID=2711 RepID=A0ACB8J5Q8_CITSI|nr:protein CURVATURE THYLAKOID 1D [Citrus sinensis]